MLFNSLHYCLFLPCVVGLYYAWPERSRWQLLLVASYYFYLCWRPEYLLLIVASTLVDYVACLRIDSDRSRRQRWLCASLSVNLGLLFVFKYFNFFNDTVRSLLGPVTSSYSVPDLDFLLPVGISFYTFQTLSYTLDVYRGNRKPERHLGVFEVYVSFFPQLVAGPIERSERLIPQLRTTHPYRHGDCRGVANHPDGVLQEARRGRSARGTRRHRLRSAIVLLGSDIRPGHHLLRVPDLL